MKSISKRNGGHEGPEEEWRYSFTLSLFPIVNGDGWLTPCLARFALGNKPVSMVLVAGWVWGPSGRCGISRPYRDWIPA
jgi:hypothetical protein